MLRKFAFLHLPHNHSSDALYSFRAAPIKRTAVEKMVNVQIIFLFFILLALSVGSAVGSFIRNHSFGSQMWYLFLSDQGSQVKVFVEDILTFIILCESILVQLDFRCQL